ncbi:MAG TPA: hypothetical protein PL143_05535 [Rhodocyclaceae bacterium]|nr:hypothetical protein [Rhodocyclaceae bacterium]
MNTLALNVNCRDAGYTSAVLDFENRQFATTGGVSQNNRNGGFVPAFLDTTTGCVYRSCFANGAPAPMHLLDGLPLDLVVKREADGRVTALKPTLVAGFLRLNRFYTREQAAQFMSRCH